MLADVGLIEIVVDTSVLIFGLLSVTTVVFVSRRIGH